MYISGKLKSTAAICLLTLSLLAQKAFSDPATRPASQPSPQDELKTIQEIQCLYNLHEIGQAILLYSDDHKGVYPVDLGTLAVVQDLEMSIFVCPASPNALPQNLQSMSRTEKSDWINTHTDYIYLGSRWSQGNLQPDSPLAYEKDDDHDNAMHVLFGDGHVEFLPVSEVHKRFGPTAGAERTTTRVKPDPDHPQDKPNLTMDQAKALLAKIDINSLMTAVEEFEIDNDRFPTSQEGLNALLQKPSPSMTHWKHAHIAKLPNDPWNHPYVYISPGLKGKDFDLFSSGPDGQPDTPDDVKP